METRQRDGLGALAGCQLVGISCMFSAASVHRLDRILEIAGFQGGLWKPVTSNSRKLCLQKSCCTAKSLVYHLDHRFLLLVSVYMSMTPSWHRPYARPLRSTSFRLESMRLSPSSKVPVKATLSL